MRKPRRRVDWSLVEGTEPTRARLVLPTGQTSGLAEITSALLSDPLSQINDKPLLAAALAAGFGSYAQFHRVFRRRFGKAPREYMFEQRVSPSCEGPGPR